jgi:hypothetical protein
VPVAMMQEFAPSEDRGTTNYDAVNERINVETDPPDGLLAHTAGFSEDGTFRIYDVWASREQAEAFLSQTLAPVLEEMMGTDAAPPAKSELYELHHVVVPG